jgi:Mini-chromosome maintenance replisome factor
MYAKYIYLPIFLSIYLSAYLPISISCLLPHTPSPSSPSTSYCVPIPGENAWVKEGVYAAQLRDPPAILRELCASTNLTHWPAASPTHKRTRSPEEDTVSVLGSALSPPSKSVLAPGRRGSGSDELSAVGGAQSASAVDTTVPGDRTASAVLTHKPVVVEHSLVMEFNRPLDALSFATRCDVEIEPTCLVKVYGSQLDSFKLNTAFEFVGVLAFVELSTKIAPMFSDE